MSRRPEIGNVQLYPDRPLQKSDRNGYVLKFYCPIRCKRIRRNCGTRDRREARRLLRKCQERLLNGKYAESNGAITEEHAPLIRPVANSISTIETEESYSWQFCYDRYVEQRRTRVRERSLDDAISRLGIAERILESYVQDWSLQGGFVMTNVATLDGLEHLQNRLLAGDECRYDERSPSTVNSMVGAVMAFIRFCHVRSWGPAIPPLERLDIDEVMKGRPVTEEEFEQMLDATESVVGTSSASSWKFALRILWGSAFRVGDVMDFSWDDPRHIYPIWGRVEGQHPTIAVPSSQKNGKVQEIPMLPELVELLSAVPKTNRTGWIACPQSVEFDFCGKADSFRPCDADLGRLFRQYNNSAISRACLVSEVAVRKWRKRFPKVTTVGKFYSEVPAKTVQALVSRAERIPGGRCQNLTERMTKERVSRVIAQIGRAAGVVVQMEDSRLNKREKFASAHDIRRGVAQRLINHGVSAETLKVIMRHKDFATTERHYGAVRSAQSAATEIVAKLKPATDTSAFVGGLMGGMKKAPQLSAEELCVLKSLLAKL